MIDYSTIGLFSLFTILGGIVATKTKLPPALGLLIVGAAIGPHALGWISGGSEVEYIIEIGAVLLLFVTGLEFDFEKIKQIGGKAFVAAVLKIGIVFFLGYHSSLWLGYDADTAVFVGAIMSFSSTLVIVKVLEQHELASRKEVPLLLAILIAEDVLAVFVLTFIEAAKGVVGQGSILGLYTVAEHVVFSVLVLAGLYAVSLVLLRPLITLVLRNSTQESVIFIDLGVCVAFSAIAYSLGLSPSIGAFFAGSVVASMPNAHGFERAIAPFSMVFSSLFFLAVGTLVQTQTLIDNAQLIGTLVVVLLVSRFIGVGLVTNIFANFKTESAVFSSLAMFSIGEFSLLIARHASSLGVKTDLVSLASGIIFISALVMALSVKRAKEGVMLIKNAIPPGLTAVHVKLRYLADYLNHGFQEMRIETTHSNKFRRSLGLVFLLAIGLFLAAYFWNNILSAVGNRLGKSLAAIAVVGFVVAGGLQFVKSVIDLFMSASVIFSTIHLDRNRGKAGQIIVLLMLFFVTFVIGLYSPFFIYLFDLDTTFNTMSLLVFGMSVLVLVRLVFLIESCYSAPTHVLFKRDVPVRKEAPFEFKGVRKDVPPPSKSKFRFER